MRDFRRPFANWFSQVAVAVLLSLLPLSYATGSEVPGFSGTWVEAQPKSGRALRLQVIQLASRVQVRISYSDAFPDRTFGEATVENGTASWTAPQSCVARFQGPGTTTAIQA